MVDFHLPTPSNTQTATSYKPCPFCGEPKPILVTDPTSGAQAVLCRDAQGCGAGAPAASWNRRAKPKLVAQAKGAEARL